MPFKDPIVRKEYDRRWRLKHPNKITLKSHKQKLKMYGMIPTDFDRLVELQNNKCKICEEVFKPARRPCVDHCHTSGKVRDLLCIGCNRALGFIKENVTTLTNMIHYINRKP